MPPASTEEQRGIPHRFELGAADEYEGGGEGPTRDRYGYELGPSRRGQESRGGHGGHGGQEGQGRSYTHRAGRLSGADGGVGGGVGAPDGSIRIDREDRSRQPRQSREREGDIDWGAVFQAIENQGDRIPSSIPGYHLPHERQQPLVPDRLPGLDELGYQLPYAPGDVPPPPPPHSGEQHLRQNWSSPDLSWQGRAPGPAAYEQQYHNVDAYGSTTSGGGDHGGFGDRQPPQPFGPGNTQLLNPHETDRGVGVDVGAYGLYTSDSHDHMSTSRPESGMLNEEDTLSLLTLLETHAHTFSTLPSPSHSPGMGTQPYPSPTTAGPSNLNHAVYRNEPDTTRSVSFSGAGSSAFPTVPGPSRPSTSTSTSRRNTLSRAPPASQVNHAPTSNGSGSTTPDDGEDKRVRNTMASAKFRAKKKEHMATVQRSITELEQQQTQLEADVANLRQENGLLREMVQLKYGLDMPKGG